MRGVSIITRSRILFRHPESNVKFNFCLFPQQLRDWKRLYHHSRCISEVITNFSVPVIQLEEEGKALKKEHFRSEILEFIRKNGVQSEADKTVIRFKLKLFTIKNFYEIRNILVQLRRCNILFDVYPEVNQFCMQVLFWMLKQQQELKQLTHSDIFELVQSLGQLGINYQTDCHPEMKDLLKNLMTKLLQEFPWQSTADRESSFPLYAQSFSAMSRINFRCSDLPKWLQKRWIADLSLFSNLRLSRSDIVAFLTSFHLLELQPLQTTRNFHLSLLDQVVRENYSELNRSKSHTKKLLRLYLTSIISCGLTARSLSPKQISLISQGIRADWRVMKLPYLMVDHLYSLGQLQFTPTTFADQTWSYIFSKLSSDFFQDYYIHIIGSAEIEKLVSTLVQCQFTSQLLTDCYPGFAAHLQHYLASFSFELEEGLLLETENSRILKNLFDSTTQLGYHSVVNLWKEKLCQMIADRINKQNNNSDDRNDTTILLLLYLESLCILKLTWKDIPLIVQDQFLKQWSFRLHDQPNWKEALHVLSVLTSLQFSRGEYSSSFNQAIIEAFKPVFHMIRHSKDSSSTGSDLLLDLWQTINQHQLTWSVFPFTVQEYLFREVALALSVLKGSIHMESFTTLLSAFIRSQMPVSRNTHEEVDFYSRIESTLRRILKIRLSRKVSIERTNQLLHLLTVIVQLDWIWSEMNHHTLLLLRDNLVRVIDQLDEKMIISLSYNLLILGFDILETNHSSDFSRKSFFDVYEMVLHRLIHLLNEKKLENLSFSDYQQLMIYLHWWKLVLQSHSSSLTFSEISVASSIAANEKSVETLQSYFTSHYDDYIQKLSAQTMVQTSPFSQLTKFLEILASTTQDALAVYSTSSSSDPSSTINNDRLRQQIEFVSYQFDDLLFPQGMKPIAVRYQSQIIAFIEIVERINTSTRSEELREYFYRQYGVSPEGVGEEMIPLIRVSQGLVQGEIDSERMFQEFIEIIHEIRDIILSLEEK